MKSPSTLLLALMLSACDHAPPAMEAPPSAVDPDATPTPTPRQLRAAASRPPPVVVRQAGEALPPECDWDHGGRGGVPACPNTGQAVPDTAVENPRCDDREADANRWMGTGPVTPLAITDSRGLRSAGHACCAPWARVGERWHALDAFGASLGVVQVQGGEGYDVTACYELEMAPTPSGARAIVYASRPPPQWMPDEWRERASDLGGATI